jgi:hypothetical protein
MAENTGNGFSVLDGVAIVAGAAVASVHLRGVLAGDPFGPGWVLLLGTFLWVGLTAAGPFLFLLRRFARGLPGSPRVGELLWAMLGLPWLLTALLQTAPSRMADAGRPDGVSNPFVATTLMSGLAITSLVALGVIWMTWVTVKPDKAAETFSPPWTNRVGLVLSIAWPIQCGVGMVVIG